MWRVGVALICMALPSLAAETRDRATPVFGLDAESGLRSFHLPDALIPGGRLLRVQFLAGFVDAPWDETYVIESNADGRPARLRHELREWTRRGVETRAEGVRALTEAEVARINASIRAIRLCASRAEGQPVVDAPLVLFEFADETRYCFASRVPWTEVEPEFGAFLDLFRDLAGVE